MGRAGIEPATLGLKVVLAGFACSRVSSESGITEWNRFCCGRAWWREPVDVLLTHLVC
jgi:hypothetical protein